MAAKQRGARFNTEAVLAMLDDASVERHQEGVRNEGEPESEDSAELEHEDRESLEEMTESEMENTGDERV